MHITLTPMRRDDRLTLERAGDTLTINGVAYDLSAIPEGATLPRAAVACDWLASDITRTGGVLHLALILPHGPDAAQATLFPAPLLLEADGPVALPGPEEVPDVD
ncbi:hypothetical protein GEU84_020750 [Fertoebacter nigrum]|uniref:Uncharacterized protein n=1 Tax=Fertoeibacter niger TaxID=2656921 RepID=A0A8X8H5F1_9RHOB|nr:hypothetical protein [Fertoeibacter niger]NUB46817.1 hypothetical protein [Fertoeibacter niger]